MQKMLFSSLMFVVMSLVTQAQLTAEQIAGRIAQKMKDSLSLTENQKSQLYTINLQMNSQKSVTRMQYGNSDSLRIKIQQIENMRDSFYRPVLTEPQYMLYRQKKRSLINNN